MADEIEDVFLQEMENYYNPPAGRAVPPPLPSTKRGKQSSSVSGPDKKIRSSQLTLQERKYLLRLYIFY
jgi:hypothetical protein